MLLDLMYSLLESPMGRHLLRRLVAEFIQTNEEHGGPPITSAYGLHRRMYNTAVHRPALGGRIRVPIPKVDLWEYIINYQKLSQIWRPCNDLKKLLQKLFLAYIYYIYIYYIYGRK